MELTQSWREVFPEEVQQRYLFAEIRSAAAILAATSPDEFADLVAVLETFYLDVDRLVRPGGSKSMIAGELDESFRRFGWREARFDQDLETSLHLFRWNAAPEPEKDQVRSTVNHYGGHKVDNVKGRAALDVEWNPKDGNLDRDISNYTALYDAGIIDVGVLVTRSQDQFREPVFNLIRDVKQISRSFNQDTLRPAWVTRMMKTPDDPYKTTTTANFEKLLWRLERGDGRGCPMLAIGIGWDTYRSPADGLRAEVARLALKSSGSSLLDDSGNI